jgi:hypothetical protein
MSLYIDYSYLAECNLIDKFIYKTLTHTIWSLILLVLIDGPILSSIPIIVLFTRTIIFNVNIRRVLGWTMIVWTYFNRMNSWLILFIIIEFIREFIFFGLPYLMIKLSTITLDYPCGETMARRLFKIIKVITQQPIFISIQQLMSIIIAYKQEDESERFNEEEKKKFQKFFRDFYQTSFLYEPNISSITIFFPSFIIRFSHEDLQLTTADAMKLIGKNDIKDEDICPICHDKYTDISIELECKHRYCHKCIFSWLNQQYTCPMCRSTVD